MSKFDYNCFYSDDEIYIGFNAEKYSEQQALDIAKIELANGLEKEVDKNLLLIEPAWIRYGFSVDLNGDKVNGYWLEFEPSGNAFKAWAVRRVEES